MPTHIEPSPWSMKGRAARPQPAPGGGIPRFSTSRKDTGRSGASIPAPLYRSDTANRPPHGPIRLSERLYRRGGPRPDTAEHRLASARKGRSESPGVSGGASNQDPTPCGDDPGRRNSSNQAGHRIEKAPKGHYGLRRTEACVAVCCAGI